jgi:hypothetical protein
MKEKKVDSVSTSAPKGAATKDESECVSGQRLNANDFRMILAEDDTEKLGGYQEKNNALSGARKLSGFVAHNLSGLLWSRLEVTDATDRDATGDPEDAI